MDKIVLRNLKLNAFIGCTAEERSRPTLLVINITIVCDLRKPGLTDELKDTVDYKTIEDDIYLNLNNKVFQLVETVAEKSADICLLNEMVKKVVVNVEKAGSLDYTESAIIEIERFEE